MIKEGIKILLLTAGIIFSLFMAVMITLSAWYSLIDWFR